MKTLILLGFLLSVISAQDLSFDNDIGNDPLLDVRCEGNLALWGVNVNEVDGTPDLNVIGFERKGDYMIADVAGYYGILACCILGDGAGDEGAAGTHKGIFGWKVQHDAADSVAQSDWSCMTFENSDEAEEQAIADLFYSSQLGEVYKPEVLTQDTTGEEGVWGKEDATKDNEKTMCFLRIP